MGAQRQRLWYERGDRYRRLVRRRGARGDDPDQSQRLGRRLLPCGDRPCPRIEQLRHPGPGLARERRPRKHGHQLQRSLLHPCSRASLCDVKSDHVPNQTRGRIGQIQTRELLLKKPFRSPRLHRSAIGGLTAQQLDQRDAQRVDVVGVPDRLLLPKLRRHVGRRSKGDAAGDAIAVELGACDAEIQHLDPAAHRQEDVSRLDVAVHDVQRLLGQRRHAGPRHIQRPRDRRDHLERRARGERDLPRPQQARKLVHVYAFDVLHDHRGPSEHRGLIDHLHDALVRQQAQQPRFVPLPRDERRIFSPCVPQHLDGNPPYKAIGAAKVRQINGAKAPFSEGTQKLESLICWSHFGTLPQSHARVPRIIGYTGVLYLFRRASARCA